MASPRPRVFSIPSSVPFLPALIAALAEGRLIPDFPDRADPLSIANATIYLPTRRACRLARDVFLETLGTEATLLPRLAPVGDIDEDELIFAEAAAPIGASALDLPAALDPIERRLLLAQLILQWARAPGMRSAGNAPLVANTPSAALALADALARLIDDMITRKVPWSQLDSLVPENVDAYWQLTLEFLKIAREASPALLAERRMIEPAERRDRLIAAEAARLETAHSGPVIAAGSTASMPATAFLLGTIARLPQGAVVLPGLDTHLDEASWRSIAGARADGGDEKRDPAVSHPQFAMQSFLAALALSREEVVELAQPARRARERLVSEALRPAAMTDRWSERIARDGVDDALATISLIEAANGEEEALAIAVALRAAVETRGKTAALITPDRALARRVMAALARWRVPVDDSGGDPLADTPAGTFARLAADTALGGLEPVTLLALLKHPLLRLGAGEGAHSYGVSALERALLRGPRPRAGSEGLAHALQALEQNRERMHRADPRVHMASRELDAARELIERLQAAVTPLEGLRGRSTSLADIAASHREVLVRLTQRGAASDLSMQEDGSTLLDLLDDIIESPAAKSLHVAAAEYPEIIEAMTAGAVVRRPPDANAQVRIFGLLEARLQPMHLVVLGGLVEGVWPPQTRSDPWLSRPMRHALGLDLPERRIGLTAHDFAQAAGAAEVIFSRADKLAGAPTVPSRFLQRLAAVAGEQHWNEVRKRGRKFVKFARALDHPAKVQPITAPAPCPPLAARPSRLSVTEIEHWLRDPYTIYAKHILRLIPLEAVDTPPGARDRGSAVHAAIEEFTKTFANGLPADPLAALLAMGRKHFAPLADFPEVKAFWWPRFERIAHWFVEWEMLRRDDIEAVHAEVQGAIEIALGERSFKLTTRADRIEGLGDGCYALLDYKTGQVPSANQVRAGLSPQLTLEAAILRAGGFDAIPADAQVEALSYVRLRGGDPPGEVCEIGWTDATPDVEAARAFERLRDLVARFEDETTPYRSLVHPMWRTRYGDYDHLARVKEWSATGGEIEDGPPS